MMRRTKSFFSVLVATLLLVAMASTVQNSPASLPVGSKQRIRSLRLLVLSTMLADAGVGEWGFAALVEADGHRLLFDTGARPDTVLKNAQELSVDLAGIRDVILSHNHSDHTGGLVTLRRELSREDKDALSRAHVGEGIFLSRLSDSGNEETNPMVITKRAYEMSGGVFIEHKEPVELFAGIWLTGPVPRVHPERNWSNTGQLRTPGGVVEDTIPEDQSLVIDTDRGLVLLSGCGHAGIVNTIEYARQQVRQAPLYAALGGFHLFSASDASLDWTGAKLREFGLANLLGAHCTGIESVFRLRERVGLSRRTCVVGAVGSEFTLEQGIDPLKIAR